jgi:hypothetical protein
LYLLSLFKEFNVASKMPLISLTTFSLSLFIYSSEYIIGSKKSPLGVFCSLFNCKYISAIVIGDRSSKEELLILIFAPDSSIVSYPEYV